MTKKMGARFAMLVAATVLAVLMVACGGDDDKGIVRAATPAPTTVAYAGPTTAPVVAQTVAPAVVATTAPPPPPAPTATPVANVAPQAPANPSPAPQVAQAAAAPAPVSLGMTISNFSFAPNPITVRANQPLTLNVTNQDQVPHTLTIMGGGGSTGRLAGGGRGSVTFTRPSPGQVQFFCEVHGAQRMSGTITILP